MQYEARRALYVSLPPLDPMNTEEARVMARCVDPNIRDQVGIRNPNFHKPEAEDTTVMADEPSNSLEENNDKEPCAKTGLPSSSKSWTLKRMAVEPSAPVPKKPRTVLKPRTRTIPEPRVKVSPRLKSQSMLGIAIGSSSSQEPGVARKPLSVDEIIYNIFNPKALQPSIENPSVEMGKYAEAAPSSTTILRDIITETNEQDLITKNVLGQGSVQDKPQAEESSMKPANVREEIEEAEFKLGEPEIPMRPATL